MGKKHTIKQFQSTPPCKGRRYLLFYSAPLYYISIHAPVQGATRTAGRSSAAPPFQSTPPCKGRLATASDDKSFILDFNPRPRARGDFPRKTLQGGRVDFNPRPRARGDLLVLRSGVRVRDFNPRPRARGDLRRRNRRRRNNISIHAPVQGATTQVGRSWRGIIFQSTPPCKGRPN